MGDRYPEGTLGAARTTELARPQAPTPDSMTKGTSHACTPIRCVRSPRRDAGVASPYCHGIARCARTTARPEGALTEDLLGFAVPKSPNCQNTLGPRAGRCETP